MRLSVAVVVRNDKSGVERLLNSLQRSLCSDAKLDILIIDNDSTVPIPQMTRSNLNIHVLKRTRNSMCEARQQALQTATSEWLAFLDSDCFVPRSWHQEVISRINSLDQYQNVLAWSGPNRNRGPGLLNACIRELGGYFAPHQKIMSIYEVAHLPTAAIFYRREAVLKLGGFPSGFDEVGEDLALSKRIVHSGHQLLLTPRPVVAHQQKQSWMEWLKRMERYGKAQSVVAKKFPEHFTQRNFIPAFALLSGLVLFLIYPLLITVLSLFGVLAWAIFRGAKRQQPLERIVAAFIVATSIIVYGWGSLKGLIVRKS